MADEPQNPAVPGDAIEATAVANLKAVAEQPAVLANLALSNLIQNTSLAQQNAVAHQQAMNQLSVAIVGKVVNLLTTPGPGEAGGAEEILTNNALAQVIADLKASVDKWETPTAEERKTTTASAGGSTLESLSGDALATAFAVLDAILGGKSDKGGKETP